MAKGTGISLRVLAKRLLLHIQAREARVWVEPGDRASKPGLRGPKGVSMPLHHRMSLQISRLYRVCLCYLAYRQGYYLNPVHRIAASYVRELGLEVEILEKTLYVSFPLGIRVSVDRICRGCELEISGILLTVDLRVIDMSEFDVILRMY